MPSLRCTGRLLKRLRQSPEPDLPAPANRLGDWYANLLNVERHRLVICMSEQTLLPVVVPNKDPGRLRERVRDAVENLLITLGVPTEVALTEIAGMEAMPFGSTANRSVLGSMNDFVFQAKHYFHAATETVYLNELEIWLAETPCKPLGYRNPIEATISKLGAT